MRRLLVLDIDGTLLDPSDIVTPIVHDAIATAREQGVEVALATGRRLKSTLPIVEEVGIELPLVVYNGALVWSTEDHAPMSRLPFDAETLEMVVERIIEGDLAPVLLQGPPAEERIIVFEDTLPMPYVDAFVNPRREEVDLVPRDTVRNFSDILTVDIFGPEEVLRGVTAEMELREFAVFHHGPLGWEEDPPHWAANVHMGAVSKAMGVSQLAAELGLTMQDVVAVGDGENDLPLLEAAGIGVAMGNAPEHVRQRADFVVRGHDEDGVAEAIERFVLPKDVGG